MAETSISLSPVVSAASTPHLTNARIFLATSIMTPRNNWSGPSRGPYVAFCVHGSAQVIPPTPGNHCNCEKFTTDALRDMKQWNELFWAYKINGCWCMFAPER
ncbi:hypothetical protein EDC01DRAFT_776080 [Geopyxis carbonaria]|nr:hypothetical protein EDC01DRAFT_776080 [Geopyxis carbonaria]